MMALNFRPYSDMGVHKADQIALPDFAFGAMENWGLVTYREQSLLFDMDRDRFSRKVLQNYKNIFQLFFIFDNNQIYKFKWYVCGVVAHEMAHMWFGNFVTCPWWDELWLNEAFASYFTYVGELNGNHPDQRFCKIYV